MCATFRLWHNSLPTPPPISPPPSPACLPILSIRLLGIVVQPPTARKPRPAEASRPGQARHKQRRSWRRRNATRIIISIIIIIIICSEGDSDDDGDGDSIIIVFYYQLYHHYCRSVAACKTNFSFCARRAINFCVLFFMRCHK